MHYVYANNKIVQIESSVTPTSHRTAHKDKEAITKGLFKLKPALNLLNVPVDMSKARSVPREKRAPRPITPERFAIGSYLLRVSFLLRPMPPLTPARPLRYSSSTCYRNADY